MRSHDPEEMRMRALRGSQEPFLFNTFTLGSTRGAGTRRENATDAIECNGQRLHCFACFDTDVCRVVLALSLEFHSLFPFSSAFPSFLFLCLQTASNGQQRSFIFVSLVSGFQRAFTQHGTATRQQTSRDRSRETRQRAATAFPHSHTRRYILQA